MLLRLRCHAPGPTRGGRYRLEPLSPLEQSSVAHRMSINQSPASATVSPIAPPEAQPASNWRSAESTQMQRVKAGFARIESAIGLSGLAAVSSGVVLAVCGMALAIQEGVPYPLAVMVGYCAAVGSACLGAALLNIRRRAPARQVRSAQAAIQAMRPGSSSANSGSRTRHVCGAASNRAARHPRNHRLGNRHAGCSQAWRTTGNCKSGYQPRAQEQRNPGWSTEIGREELISWAQAHGHSPRFLQK